jgi:hypothetical protein
LQEGHSELQRFRPEERKPAQRTAPLIRARATRSFKLPKSFLANFNKVGQTASQGVFALRKSFYTKNESRTPAG